MQSCDYRPNLVHLPVSPMKLDFLFLKYFRKSSASKMAQNRTQPLPRTSASVAGGNEVGKNLEGAVENEDSLIPMKMPTSFIDAKVLKLGNRCAPFVFSLCVKFTWQKMACPVYYIRTPLNGM